MENEMETIKRLLREAYEHLEYCNWGSSWEQECSVDLRKELDEYFKQEYYFDKY